MAGPQRFLCTHSFCSPSYALFLLILMQAVVIGFAQTKMPICAQHPPLTWCMLLSFCLTGPNGPQWQTIFVWRQRLRSVSCSQWSVLWRSRKNVAINCLRCLEYQCWQNGRTTKVSLHSFVLQSIERFISAQIDARRDNEVFKVQDANLRWTYSPQSSECAFCLVQIHTKTKRPTRETIFVWRQRLRFMLGF